MNQIKWVNHYTTGENMQDIVVRDQWAYITETWGVEVLNIRNPKGIYVETYLPYPNDNGTNSLTLNNDNYLYVIDGVSGLLVFDLNEPWNPQPVGSGYETDPDAASAVAALDNYVYMVVGNNLKVLDVTRKNSPIPIGAGYTP